MSVEINFENKVDVDNNTPITKERINNREYVKVNNVSNISGLEMSGMNNNTNIKGGLLDMTHMRKNNNNNLSSDSYLTSSPKKGDVRRKQEMILQDMTSENPMDYIDIAKSAIISQIVDKKVFLSGCDPPIRYIIEIVTYMGEEKRILRCKETPRWCQKNCCQ